MLRAISYRLFYTNPIFLMIVLPAVIASIFNGMSA